MVLKINNEWYCLWCTRGQNCYVCPVMNKLMEGIIDEVINTRDNSSICSCWKKMWLRSRMCKMCYFKYKWNWEI